MALVSAVIDHDSDPTAIPSALILRRQERILNRVGLPPLAARGRSKLGSHQQFITRGVGTPSGISASKIQRQGKT
jgi:hypothetical protein